jgi:small subunit ribosomal protein S2
LPIPGNDDSIRSIELMLAKLADAVLEGKASLPPDSPTGPRSRPAASGNGAGVPAAPNPKPAPAVVE